MRKTRARLNVAHAVRLCSQLRHAGLCLSSALCALILVGCAVIPKPASQTRIADIHPLYYGPSGATYVGGMMDVQVRLAPSEDGQMHVGVFEEYANTTGEMWRASVWLATFQSMLASYMPTQPFRVSVEVRKAGETQTDGPSAGGVITAALLAMQRNIPIRPAFTMTGTVNPDGSIGPVGGIVLKFEGALKGGKKILGYPLAQGVQRDPRTGEKVDLKKHFAGKGAQVVEIRDVYDAYHHMTGRKLTRPTPLDGQRMLPSKVLSDVMSRCTKDWTKRTDALLKTWLSLPLSSTQDKQRDAVILTIKVGQKHVQTLLSRGDAAGAYWQAVGTHNAAQWHAVKAHVSSYVGRGQYDRGLRVFNRIERRVQKAFDTTVKRLARVKPRTVSELLTLVDAAEALVNGYGKYQEARTLHGEATAEINRLKSQLESDEIKADEAFHKKVEGAVTQPLLRLAYAEQSFLLAGDNLEFKGQTNRAIRFDPVDLKRLEKFLTGASRALLYYFQTTTVERYWRKATVPFSADGLCRLPHASLFPDKRYSHAKQSLRFAEHVARLMPQKGSVSPAVIRMAGGYTRYMEAAALTTIHYSLGMFKKGSIAPPKRPEAFAAMLKMAEVKAREHAAAAHKSIGEVPVPAKIAYRIAQRYDRSTAPYWRMFALEQYWRSSMFSQLAVAFSRRLGGDTSSPEKNKR